MYGYIFQSVHSVTSSVYQRLYLPGFGVADTVGAEVVDCATEPVAEALLLVGTGVVLLVGQVALQLSTWLTEARSSRRHDWKATERQKESFFRF